ncbi:MAG: hypothetical protein ACKPE1_28525 [Dolichospermum sp.]
MRYILSPLSKSGEGVGGGVTLYLITSVSAVNLYFCGGNNGIYGEKFGE